MRISSSVVCKRLNFEFFQSAVSFEIADCDCRLMDRGAGGFCERLPPDAGTARDPLGKPTTDMVILLLTPFGGADLPLSQSPRLGLKCVLGMRKLLPGVSVQVNSSILSLNSASVKSKPAASVDISVISNVEDRFSLEIFNTLLGVLRCSSERVMTTASTGRGSHHLWLDVDRGVTVVFCQWLQGRFVECSAHCGIYGCSPSLPNHGRNVCSDIQHWSDRFRTDSIRRGSRDLAFGSALAGRYRHACPIAISGRAWNATCAWPCIVVCRSLLHVHSFV